MTDQYDAILRALEAGTLLTVNGQPNVGETPSDELEVKSSRSDQTDVYTKGADGKWYRICRDSNGELIYFRENENRSEYQGEIITIEITGVVA